MSTHFRKGKIVFHSFIKYDNAVFCRTIFYREMAVIIFPDIRQDIENSYVTIPLDNLEKVVQVVVFRTNKGLEDKGYDFEHLL